MVKVIRTGIPALLAATIVSCSLSGAAFAQVEAPNSSDPCEKRIAAARAELYRLDESQSLDLGGGVENRDSPLGTINSMVDDAQSALDRGNEARCVELIGSAESSLQGLER